ncbi:MAG: 3' terminal RNA ribose 2'-O-methyltransferase Hen1 [Anaerolineales bacterium]|nr:3' terminal RNA ribose 2'-O-methyltransferase Hen1 [Anaerolineales bacterium]
MLLTITTTYKPATDLGFLLYKHPQRVQTFKLNFGKAHVFYPEASENQCTVALLLDIDPIALVKKYQRSAFGSFALQQYVNDRPYVGSSFLSVAIANVFGTALNGRSKDRPVLAQTPIPLKTKIAVVPCHGGEPFLRRLFEPLGYKITIQRHQLDHNFPEWGESRYYTVELENIVTVSDLLSHLYVLIPVLDDEKHYWVGEHEVEKLLAHSGNWLATHPEKEEITARYLKRQRILTQNALAQLSQDGEGEAKTDNEKDAEEGAVEQQIGLHQQRLDVVVEELEKSGAARVLDLGCGEGKLLRLLLHKKQFTEIVGMDVSYTSLERANERLRLDRLPEKQRERIRLMQGSLMYRDERLSGYDAAAVVEVIEHLDTPRLQAFERVVFEFARPATIIITTPNQEYNIMWSTLPAGKFRHRDHRFEWTREEFSSWAQDIAEKYGYQVHFRPLGPVDETVGAPSQMGVFTR